MKSFRNKLAMCVLMVGSFVGVADAAQVIVFDVSQSEPYFQVVPKASAAFTAVATQLEPYFDVAPEPGEAFAAVATQSEPYFDVKTGDQVVAATGPHSQGPFSLQAMRPQGRH